MRVDLEDGLRPVFAGRVGGVDLVADVLGADFGERAREGRVLVDHRLVEVEDVHVAHLARASNSIGNSNELLTYHKLTARGLGNFLTETARFGVAWGKCRRLQTASRQRRWSCGRLRASASVDLGRLSYTPLAFGASVGERRPSARILRGGNT